MSELRTYDLYEPFKGEYQKHFRFLQDNFGCRLVDAKESVYEASVTYTNATTGVEITFDPRENYILVSLIRLIGGEVVPYHVAPHNWLYLHELLEARAPSTVIHGKKHGDWMTGPDMERILSEYADALRRYGDDILRGDFSLFTQLVEARRRRYEEKLRRRLDS